MNSNPNELPDPSNPCEVCATHGVTCDDCRVDKALQPEGGVTDATYTLTEPEHDKPRFEGDTILCGTTYRVLRDGVHVASIYEHPSRYAEGQACVGMTMIRWAGKMAHGYPKNPDGALFFDFVSSFTTAEETLPECIRRVERIIEWREANP